MIDRVDHGDPISYLALEDGTDVFASDGERVGTVEHVLADAESDIFEGLIIDTRSGPGGWHFADAEQVDAIYERGVVLNVAAGAVERLPEPSAAPGVIENHGAEDSESPLQHKLRRAWDYLSGNY
jgi:sporulation protein YlmC with PRC-barrel domain